VTYQKGSNKLQLAGAGPGGVKELVEELHSAKAMYGLFKFQLNEERTKVNTRAHAHTHTLMIIS